MAAQLQPAIELAVVRQQYLLVIGTDKPGRARDMAAQQRALKTIRLRLNEGAAVITLGRLLRVSLAIMSQQLQQGCSVHLPANHALQ